MDLEHLISAARAFLVSRNMPHQIEIKHPPGSPAAGAPRGRYLLKLQGDGSCRYEYMPEDPSYTPAPAVAELEVAHRFGDVPSLIAFLDPHDHADVWLDVQDTGAALVGVLDPTKPELGTVRALIPRHQSWVDWAAGGLGSGAAVELSHEALADRLNDYEGELVEPAMAVLVSRFRGAVKIDYEPTLDRPESSGLRISWKGQATDAQGAKMDLPKTFGVMIKPWVGAWEPGSEPALRAIFTLRPVPPKDGAVPTFRLRWQNAAEFRLAAGELLRRAILSGVEALEGNQRLMLGVPASTHRLLPK